MDPCPPVEVAMERIFGNDVEEQWRKQYIYKVPESLKMSTNSNAYTPEFVALGPFHHNDENLLPMEEHKNRALLHLVRRSNKTIKVFLDAVSEVTQDLKDAYKGLGDEWLGEDKNEQFVEMMLTDGCFLLEVMSMHESRGGLSDYDSNDPVFSDYAYQSCWPIIFRDIILLENQLPLLLIQKIQAVLDPRKSDPRLIKTSVLFFLDRRNVHVHNVQQEVNAVQDGEIVVDIDIIIEPLGLHPLHILHSSFTYNAPQDKAVPIAVAHAPRMECIASCIGMEKSNKYREPLVFVTPNAEKMREAGIHFRKSRTDSLLDIRFQNGVLSMPYVEFDFHKEIMFLNLMAFERLHPSIGSGVTSYVCFMDRVIDTGKDVELLKSENIIDCQLGSDEELAKLFNNTLNKVGRLSKLSRLHDVHRQVNEHCLKPWNKWRANLIQTYFSNPWVFISLIAAFTLLGATLLQTTYTVMPYYTKS